MKITFTNLNIQIITLLCGIVNKTCKVKINDPRTKNSFLRYFFSTVNLYVRLVPKWRRPRCDVSKLCSILDDF